MAVYRNIRVDLWRNPKVLDDMNSKEKLFYVYLLTNSCTTQIGIYKISKNQISSELDMSIKSITTLLKKFEHDLNIIKYNDKTHEIAIKNWGRYNFKRCGKPMIDCIQKELNNVNDLELIKFVAQRIEKCDVKLLYEAAYNKCDFDNLDNDTYAKVSNVKSISCTQKEEKEQEKEEKQEINKNVLSKYSKIYTENIGVINNIVAQWLIEVSNKVDIDLFKRAVEIATNTGKLTKGYVNGIINKWEQNNIKTIEDLKAFELQEKNNKVCNIRPINLHSDVTYNKPSEEDLAYARSLSEIIK